ncbi:LemA family protein [Sphingomonas sp. C3-2]|uniref:LemA family protein n=1 Tax=Sphingomonas sp. C3-2 TaxID=3062169 RepID=UPI00294B3131|nr:LemA family protein [Sphingomonas sp. C3-2]WOK37906.1 LemA family protein [Sphingomonas sp. C3-2]
MKARFFLGLMLASTLAACGINSVPTAEENAKAKWANVQADYQRRADLVPNLVETVKGYAKQEKDVLTQVTEARAKATSVQVTAEDLDDPAKVQQFQQAQTALSGSLGRLLATVEAYPDLKSNANFLALQSQLEGTENRINVSIKDYNEAVQQYNTTIRTFPDIIGAKIVHGAKPMVPYQAQAGSDQAPKVNFGG